MAPKYRGKSEDWLDSEDARKSQAAARSKKKSRSADQELLRPEPNGRVIEIFPSMARVRTLDQKDLLCRYRRSRLIQEKDVRERSLAAVGDYVWVEATGSRDGVIEQVFPRKTQWIRPAPGREEGNIHVIAANMDVVVLVSAVAQPEFAIGFADRFLIAAQVQKVQPILCINKIDLHGSTTKPWNIYSELGYPVYEVSARSQEGVDQLRSELLGRSVTFFGHSGVGKTSILRTLVGDEVGRVGEVNEFTGKGKHTTTGAVLIDAPGESFWIDTPGVREFGLIGVDPEQLHHFFPEFKDQDMIKPPESVLSSPRYESYLRILESLKNEEA